MSVTVETLIKYFDLEVLVEGEKGVEITVNDINRPGLQLAGFYNYFAPERLQVVGKAEWSFIGDMSRELRRKRVDKYFSFNSQCVVITRGLEPHEEFIKAAKKNKTWLLRTTSVTTSFISKMTIYLSDKFAPQTRLHGVLVDVYGIGILITGESGIGKSEAALELIKRGHRLVTDYVVELRKVSEDTLIGTAPDITKHFIELRGIGIIDVKTLFGVACVRETQNIDLVIRLEEWDKDKEYDRLGLQEEYTEYLGNKIVCHSIPIRPGRNLSIICEAAAVNHRQKKMGYNAAQELYNRVQRNLAQKREEEE